MHGHTDPSRRRRAIATLSWRTVVILITGVAAWEAAGQVMLGDAGYTSPSFELLRRVPGGMRAYGWALGALALTTVFAYGRQTRDRHDVLLRVCLAGLAGWYTGWLAMILYTWFVQGHVADWGSVGRIAFLAAMCVIASRSAPRAETTAEE